MKGLFKQQLELAKRSILKDSFGTIKRIGGVDCSYPDNGLVIGGLVVLDLDTLKPVYRTFSLQKLTFPYIPGLLAYREADAMIGAITKAKVKPDMVMVDGFGTNHPRRCGIATHIGIELDMPTIGVGKNFLCGEIKGDYVYQGGEKVGRLAYRRGMKRPVYISPGHRISLESAVRLASECTITGKIPEPVRLAHEYVTRIKKFTNKKK